MGYSLKNVDKWTYNTRAQLEALPDDTLLKLERDLTMACRLFHQQGVPWSDEMFWLFINVPDLVRKRKLTSLPIPHNDHS